MKHIQEMNEKQKPKFQFAVFIILLYVCSKLIFRYLVLHPSSIIVHQTQVASHRGSVSSKELARCLLDLSLMLLLPATRCNICEIGEMVENPIFKKTSQQGLTYL